MSNLVALDYENLFKFDLEINKSYEQFEYRVLDALSEYLDINLCSYTIYDHNPDGTSTIRLNISRTIDADILNRYTTDFRSFDEFVNNYDKFRFASASKGLFSSSDFEEEAFKNSPYGKLLAQYNVGHQVVLGLKSSVHSPVHTISIFQTITVGKFTNREMELFEHINAIFFAAVERYKEFARLQRITHVGGKFLDTLNTGYALLDKNDNIMSHNDTYVKYSSMLSSKDSLSDVTEDIVGRITDLEEPGDRSGKPSSKMDEGNFTITIYRQKFASDFGLVAYKLITIDNNEPETSVASSRMALMENFDLTSREAEVTIQMALGLDNNEIADVLVVSLSTVKSHIHNIYAKLEVRTRTELLRKVHKYIRKEGD